MKTAFLLFAFLLITFTVKAQEFNSNQKQYLSTNNLLINPGFENGLTTWDKTGDTSTKTLESTVVISGLKSAKFVASNQAISLKQSSTLYQAQFADGVQGLASVRIKSNVAVNVCSIQAGVVSTTNCVITATDKWGLYKVPTILGAISNGISIASTGNVTGTVYVDDAFVGAMDNAQLVTNDYGPTLYAPTLTTLSGSVTNYSTSLYHSRRGKFLKIQGRILFSAPSSAFTAVYIPLPSGLSIDTTILTAGVDNVGNVKLVDNGVTSFDGNARFDSATSILLFYNSIVTHTGTAPVAMSNSFTNAIPFTFNTGDSIAVDLEVPIDGWGTSSAVYTSTCGANCVDSLSAKVDGSVISKENIEWLGTSTPAGTNSYTKTLTVNAGVFTQTPNCTCTTINSTTAVDQTCSYAEGASTNTSIIFYTSSNGVATDLDFNVSCQKQGADFVATRNIIGSFSEVVTSQGTTSPDIQSVYFGTGANCTAACTTGTCTICAQVGNKITSVTWSATGTYLVNGINGLTYNCTGQAFTTASAVNSINHIKASSTSSYAQITASNSAGALLNGGYASAQCLGVK